MQEITPAARRKIPIDSGYRSAILDGLHAAAQSPGGTSYAVFGGFPSPGGRQDRDRGAPRPGGPVLVCRSSLPTRTRASSSRRRSSEGGFGVDSAAPIALAILSEYFKARAEPVGDAGVE